MMTLLHGLNSVAARRGDGLRPELLKTTARSPTWEDAEKMINPPRTGVAGDGAAHEGAASAGIAKEPIQKR